jgi:hypothetical protein
MRNMILTGKNIKTLIIGAVKLIKGFHSVGVHQSKPFSRFLQISTTKISFPDISKLESYQTHCLDNRLNMQEMEYLL